jgi:hypothetical protein
MPKSPEKKFQYKQEDFLKSKDQLEKNINTTEDQEVFDSVYNFIREKFDGN